MKRSLWLPLLAFIGALCIALGIYFLIRDKSVPTSAHAPVAPSKPPIQVFANRMWTKTVTVNEGDKISISAAGQVNIAATGDGADKWVGPDGWGNTPTWYSPSGAKHQYVYETDSLGALRGKIGDGTPFKVGSNYTFTASSAGVLFLGVEDTVDASLYVDNRGSFNVEISVSSSKTITVAATDKWKDSAIQVSVGQRVSITASGSVVWDKDLPPVGPNGTYPASRVESSSDFPFPSAGCGSLLMKIGDTIYPVGGGDTFTVREAGSLRFMVNDRYNYLYNNSGSFSVKVELLD